MFLYKSAYQAIDKGLGFINQNQLPGGGFKSYCTEEYSNNFDLDKAYKTTFYPSLIGLALKNVQTETSQNIKQKIYDWLLTQKSDQWSFNYWDRQSEEVKFRPYPDDLDDTFCALAFLQISNPDILSGKTMAAIARMLFAAEDKEGGPYRTWLVNKNASKNWKDVDLAVNANIARFLSSQNVTLPNLNAFIEKSLNGDKLQSPYYPDIYQPAYFISLFYKGLETAHLSQLLIKSQGKNYWGGPQNAALCLTSLLNNGIPPKILTSCANYIIDCQNSNGSWQIAPFNIDSRNNDQPIYMGAATLSTAICVEALNLYCQTAKPLKKIKSRSTMQKAYLADVKAVVMAEIKKTSSVDLRHHLKRTFKRILKLDKDGQVILLPYMVATSSSLKIKNQDLLQLSLLSLWGWMAYTIYDDFLDSQPDKALLPAANFCNRQLILTIKNINKASPDFQNEAFDILTKMDDAAAWEITHCRVKVSRGVAHIGRLPAYGNFWQLADRSLGHSISILGLAYMAGFVANSETTRNLRTFLKNYLIARQLNDEAHDWEEDLRNGHINAVGAEIIRRRLIRNKSRTISIDKEIDELRSIFWEESMPVITKHIYFHLDKADSSLSKLTANFDTGYFHTMLEPIKKAVDNSLRTRDHNLSFIDAL